MGPMALVLSDVLRRFQDRHPAAQVHVREVQPPDPLVPLRSGEVDLALLWLPVREPDLTVGPVLRSTEVLLMAGATHPLAGRDSVCLEDFGDHAVVGGGSIPAYMEEVLNPFHTPSGRPVARGPRVTTLHDALAAVGRGGSSRPSPATSPRTTPGPTWSSCPCATPHRSSGPSSGAPPPRTG
ncbi:hypothetical protein GCM10027610_109890 [Dactylosporangium cerinum]